MSNQSNQQEAEAPEGWNLFGAFSVVAIEQVRAAYVEAARQNALHKRPFDLAVSDYFKGRNLLDEHSPHTSVAIDLKKKIWNLPLCSFITDPSRSHPSLIALPC